MTALSATLKRAALVGLASIAGISSANAGIIVTIGRPSPELLHAILSRPANYHGHQNQGYCRDQIFCVDLPFHKQICTETVAMRDETEVPDDWSCLELADGIYYCEASDEEDGVLADEDYSELITQPSELEDDVPEEHEPAYLDGGSRLGSEKDGEALPVGSGAHQGGAIIYEPEVAQACQSSGLSHLGFLAGLGVLAWRRRR